MFGLLIDNSKRAVVLLFFVLLITSGCKDKKDQENQIIRSVKTIILAPSTSIGNRQI